MPWALRLSPVSSLIPGASFCCPVVSPPSSHRADIPNYSVVSSLTYHLAFALSHCIPHHHCTLHSEPLHPFHYIWVGSPNYSTGKLISFASTLHFDAMAASAVPWYHSPILGASLFAAPWYPISIYIWVDIPNCYGSIYRPLPHLRVWYSRCICGCKLSHL